MTLIVFEEFLTRLPAFVTILCPYNYVYMEIKRYCELTFGNIYLNINFNFCCGHFWQDAQIFTSRNVIPGSTRTNQTATRINLILYLSRNALVCSCSGNGGRDELAVALHITILNKMIFKTVLK